MTAHYLINSSFPRGTRPHRPDPCRCRRRGTDPDASCSRPGAPGSSPPSPRTRRKPWRGKPARTRSCVTPDLRTRSANSPTATASTSCMTASARTLSTAPSASLRIRGSLVLFGAASGPVPPFDPQRLNAGGSLSLTRPTIGHFLQNPQERRWRSVEIFAAAASGASTSGLAERTRWPKRPRPTATWKPARPPARYCWSPDRVNAPDPVNAAPIP